MNEEHVRRLAARALEFWAAPGIDMPDIDLFDDFVRLAGDRWTCPWMDGEYVGPVLKPTGMTPLAFYRRQMAEEVYRRQLAETRDWWSICPVCLGPTLTGECSGCGIYFCVGCRLWWPWEDGGEVDDGRGAMCLGCHDHDLPKPFVGPATMVQSALDAYRRRKSGEGYLWTHRRWEENDIRDRSLGIDERINWHHDVR